MVFPAATAEGAQLWARDEKVNRHRQRSAFYFRWLNGFPSCNGGSEKVRDTRPEGGKTLNRKLEDILHQTLNGFPSRNDGRRKDTGKRSKDQYASAIGTLHASGGEMIWEQQR